MKVLVAQWWLMLCDPWNVAYQVPLSMGFSRQEYCSSCPTLWPHGQQYTRLPCPSPTPEAYSNSCPSSRWCHPTTSTSVVPFCFNHSQHQVFSNESVLWIRWPKSIGSFSFSILPVLPVNIQDWFPLGWTGYVAAIPFSRGSSPPRDWNLLS